MMSELLKKIKCEIDMKKEKISRIEKKTVEFKMFCFPKNNLNSLIYVRKKNIYLSYAKVNNDCNISKKES